MTDVTAVREISDTLDRWIEAQHFIGWDPFDALNSNLLQFLTFGSRRLGQVWVQLLKRSPVNVRPLLGIEKGYNAKAMGLFLASYQRKYWLEPDRADERLQRVMFLSDWLERNVSTGYRGACWGYNFDWPNRNFFAPRGTPTIVNTGFITLAFLDLVHRPITPALTDRARTLVRSACEFVTHDLNRSRDSNGNFCFSYTPLDTRCVHNANLLGAVMIAEVAVIDGDSKLLDLAIQSARFTTSRQKFDGSWAYGENANESWVDNFHTGYLLVALSRIAELVDTKEFDSCLERGYAFWKTLFIDDRIPSYYPDRPYPIDSHCVAQAVLTLLRFSRVDNTAEQQAQRVMNWAIENLWNPVGHFDYAIKRTHRNRIPYMRWTQAWMQRAMTEWHYRV